jgi:hypothetical protein
MWAQSYLLTRPQAVADDETKSDLCDRIGKVAAKFAPSRRWHIDTLTKVSASVACMERSFVDGTPRAKRPVGVTEGVCPCVCVRAPSPVLQVLSLAGSSDESGIDASLLILISQVGAPASRLCLARSGDAIATALCALRTGARLKRVHLVVAPVQTPELFSYIAHKLYALVEEDSSHLPLVHVAIWCIGEFGEVSLRGGGGGGRGGPRYSSLVAQGEYARQVNPSLVLFSFIGPVLLAGCSAATIAPHGARHGPRGCRQLHGGPWPCQNRGRGCKPALQAHVVSGSDADAGGGGGGEGEKEALPGECARCAARSPWRVC